MAELDWIKRLQSAYLIGLNENIYRVGNISYTSNIDIFDIVSKRKRKRRSKGKRINRNIKSRYRKFINVMDLNNIFKRLGMHAFLSKLSSLSIPALNALDTEIKIRV